MRQRVTAGLCVVLASLALVACDSRASGSDGSTAVVTYPATAPSLSPFPTVSPIVPLSRPTATVTETVAPGSRPTLPATPAVTITFGASPAPAPPTVQGKCWRAGSDPELGYVQRYYTSGSLPTDQWVFELAWPVWQLYPTFRARGGLPLRTNGHNPDGTVITDPPGSIEPAYALFTYLQTLVGSNWQEIDRRPSGGPPNSYSYQALNPGHGFDAVKSLAQLDSLRSTWWGERGAPAC